MPVGKNFAVRLLIQLPAGSEDEYATGGRDNGSIRFKVAVIAEAIWPKVGLADGIDVVTADGKYIDTLIGDRPAK